MEEFTQHISLPLPHPDNALDQDIFRLRDALTLVDKNIHAIHLILQSDDVDLDQLQELVNAIKANRSDIVRLLASKASLDYVDGRLLQIMTELDAKASQTQVAAKADRTYVDTQLSKKADAASVSDGFGNKADAADLDATNKRLSRMRGFIHFMRA